MLRGYEKFEKTQQNFSLNLFNSIKDFHLVICVCQPKADDLIQNVTVEDEPGLQVSCAVGVGCFTVWVQARLQSDKVCMEKVTQLAGKLPTKMHPRGDVITLPICV